MSDLVRIQPEHVTVQTPLGELRVAEIALGRSPRGLVVLLCDERGLEHDAVEVMNLLAEHGYESAAAELPRGSCPSSSGTTVDDLAAGTLLAILSRALERGWAHDQIGVVGVGAGAGWALTAATYFTLGAAVSMSPDHVLSPHLTDSLETPWLGMFGEQDDIVGLAGIEELRRRLQGRARAFTEVVVYDGVGRDFHSDHLHGHARAASFDAWQRTLEWFNLRVAPRPTELALVWRRRHAVPVAN